MSISRRHFVKSTFKSFAAFSLSTKALSSLPPSKLLSQSFKNIQTDVNGLILPPDFSSRIVAKGRKPVSNTSYNWHIFADGGACFDTKDGGWIYTSNCEAPAFLGGGASAMVFNQQGEIVDAYRILSGTELNCAGGPTPWQTWLSCEEKDLGYVYECDIFGQISAQKREVLGAFRHEAVTFDPQLKQFYLTEDEPDGRFYRFTPSDKSRPNEQLLDQGVLEVLSWNSSNQQVSWTPLENPTPKTSDQRTRYQIKHSTPFNGGEGVWYFDGHVYFSSKGDNRIWDLDVAGQKLKILYDASTHPNPILTGVDNITVSNSGHVLVAEDGGDMQVVAITPSGKLIPIVQVQGQSSSEITGIAFNPTQDRLYFSSQRGSLFGITYEIQGPFANLLSR